MTCQATSVQCSVSSVQCPGITGVSSVQYTYIFILRTVRQHFLLEAAGKVQIVYKALFAKLQRSATLPWSLSLSLSFNVAFVVSLGFWQLWRQCLISRPIACTHTGTHAKRAKERERESARGGWTYCLASNAHSAVYLCVCLRVCVEWQKVNCISLAVH